MASTPHDDVDVLTRRLADECQKAGLNAIVVAPTRVHVSLPGGHARLSETVRCMPDDQERLTWWWSWGDPIGPATAITETARQIAHVVTPPVAGHTL